MQEFKAPTMRASGAPSVDDYNAMITAEAKRLLGDDPSGVVVVYPDGERDTLILDRRGEVVVAPHDESPEMEPMLDEIPVEESF